MPYRRTPRRAPYRQPARASGGPAQRADALGYALLVLDQGEADVAVASRPKPTPGDVATFASSTSSG